MEATEFVDRVKQLVDDEGVEEDEFYDAVRKLVYPDPYLDTDTISDTMERMMNEKDSHFHLYMIDRDNFNCANCGYGFDKGVDIALVAEFKVGPRTTGYRRFCFNRDKHCAAFTTFKQYRWINIPSQASA